jgi:hypothetical protein
MKLYITPPIFSAQDYIPRKSIIIQTDAIDISILANDITTCHANFHIPTEDEILNEIGEKIKKSFISLMKEKQYKDINSKEYRMIQYLLIDI